MKIQSLFLGVTILVNLAFVANAEASADDSRSRSGGRGSCLSRLAQGRNSFHVKIKPQALRKMFAGHRRFNAELTEKNLVLLVDYSIPSQKKRGYLIDLKACDVLAHEFVAHGGTIYTPRLVRYSDPDQDGLLNRCVHRDGTRTNMTRPGFYVTMGCHMTQKNFPLVSGRCGGVKIWGLEKRNDDAYNAGVVLHEHEAMFEGPAIKPEGQGCPIFAPGRLKQLLQHNIFEGALVYLYVPQCGPA